jgi:hypothetical protein
VLALKNDKPDAVIPVMQCGNGFYCIATRINGADIPPRRCSSNLRLVLGPRREHCPLLDRSRRFSEFCKSMGEQR